MNVITEAEINARADAEEASSIMDLVYWVEGARFLIDQMETACRLDPELRDMLRQHGIGLGHHWEREESSALCLLMLKIMSGIAGAERLLCKPKS